MTVHFLAGLPRSGSTLLAAILNQHPDVYASSTSGLIDLMGSACQAWEQSPTIKAQNLDQTRIYGLLNAVMTEHYKDVSKRVVMDKSRGWPAPPIMATMEKVLGTAPKIIATVRRVPDCAASFVRIAKPKDVDHFLRTDQTIQHLKSSYQTLEAGLSAAPDNFLVVDYDDLMDDPRNELARIHAFLDLPAYDYDLNAIEGAAVSELDEEVWKIPDLHKVAPVLQRQHNQNSRDVLGHHYDQFDQPAFWRGEVEDDKPKHLLDLELEAGLRGDFDKAWDIAQVLEAQMPENHRAAFNRGWYVLKQGKLQEGMQLLNRGRLENVFGNTAPDSPMPLWDGQTTGTILLNLEGGIGDQLHGARFARDIALRGNKVVVACSGQIAGIIEQVEGVSAVVQHEAAFGAYHDAWVPSMTAVLQLGYEFKDISGEAYIPYKKLPKSRKLRIGIRWKGNPQFEHEQHRVFPSELLFNALKGFDARFISLQRDTGEDERPDWVETVPLSHWGMTRDAIAGCDLVISSCTSVAHLAAAMGKETWIVVPLLPYYLWADMQPTTPWYDKVRLFRQEKYGDWEAPFKQITELLVQRQEVAREA